MPHRLLDALIQRSQTLSQPDNGRGRDEHR